MNLSKTPSGESESSLTKRKTPTKSGRPARKGNPPVTWSIRGVEPDTRAIIEKAAERSGKTIGQFINEDIRAFVQGQLTKGSQPPASPKDIQNQIDHLTQMVERIVNRLPEQGKKSIWKRLFG
jgi:ribosomal protein S7